MIPIPLAAIPNQSLSIRLNTRRYEITLQVSAGIMVATIVRDGTLLVQGMRCSSSIPLLPPYKEDNSGNFVFETEGGDYPDYTKFDSTQSLLYVSDTELKDIRG